MKLLAMLKNMMLLAVLITQKNSLAHPDVSFLDSSNYNEAYLSHVLEGQKVKFTLSGPILDFRLPEKFYDVKALEDFIKNNYRFDDSEMEHEFAVMLHQSFRSQFTAKRFLSSLINVLIGFEEHEAKKDIRNTGCSAQTNGTNYSILELLFALMALRIASVKKLTGLTKP